MVHTFDGFNWFIRLQKGERLKENLEKFMAEIDNGAWVSGVGAAQEVELSYYDLKAKEYQNKTFTDLLEVVSLQGNIALNEEGKPVFHLHGVFSGADYQTIGGHVKDLVAGGTLELFIHRAYKPVHRKHDEETGLNLLEL